MEMRRTDDDNVIRAIAYVHGMKLAGRFLAIYCIVQGIAIIVGGEARFHDASYSTAFRVPGAPWTWGVTLLACGVVAIIGAVRENGILGTIGFMGGGLWSAGFGIAFLISALHNPDANTTAIYTYGLQCSLFMIGAVVYHTAYRQGKRGHDRHPLHSDRSI